MVRGARVGAAVFVAGLALVGPQSMGSAAADTSDADPAPSLASDAAVSPAASKAARPDRTSDRQRGRLRATPAGPAAQAPDPDPSNRTTRTSTAVSDSVTTGSKRSAARAAVSGEAVADQRRQPLPAAVAARLPGADTSVSAAGSRPVAAALPTAAATLTAGPVSVTADGCAACWGSQAPTVAAAIETVVNHVFNTTFDWLSTLSDGPFTSLLEGALVLLRRTLFLIPLGVTASQVGTELTVSVNPGSVAYLRQNGTALEVSGLPTFGTASTFDAASVTEVETTNPGNAGCAGLVVESGLIGADLTTSQIDTIRFGSNAAFIGAVSAEATDGPLTVRDAVRGYGGVTLDAAVVLGSSTEIDAGNGNVNFTGTVDAMNAGVQSLTVTALGKTVFGGAVGGQASLASLITRGVEPLDIKQSADSRTIPLHYAPFVEPDGKVQVKYGINVAIGDNPAQLYEFDTGGTAFFAGYNPPFWKDVPLTSVGDSVSFSSGNTFNFVAADGPVKLGDGDQTVSTGQPIQVGAILSGGNVKKDTTFDFTDPDAPPVDGNFFGDFGASFGIFSFQEPGQEIMASPLLQLPGNLSTGFLVQLGPIGTTNPQLTVGITDDLREQFPYAVPVNAAPGTQTYPVSGYSVLELFGITPTYYADGPDGEKPIGCGKNNPCPQALETVIDSGAPSTGLRVTEGTPYEVNVDSEGKGQLQPGVDLVAKFLTVAGRPPLTWRLTAGDNPSVDFVGYGGESAATKQQNANTGLNFYNNFDVMFDASQKIIWLRPNDGAASVIAGAVTTTGDQTFKQNAELGGVYTTGGGKFTVGGVTKLRNDTVIDTGSGDVSFFGTVDALSLGGQDLTINSTGTTLISRGVGEVVPLRTFTTNGGGTTATAGMTTVGNQNFGDDATLSGAYVSTGSFSVAGDTRLSRDVIVTAAGFGGAITFDGRIDGAPGRGFQLRLSTFGGTIDLNGDVGATNPLGGLTVDELPVIGGSATTTFTADGSIALSGGVGNASTKGLSVGGSGPVVLNLTKGGVVQGFTDSGIVIGDGSSGTLSNFSISNNGGDGIQANDTKKLTLSDNVLFGNEVGIRITSSSSTDAKNTISSNTIGANGQAGVVVETALGNQIEGNAIFGNGSANTDGDGNQTGPRTKDGIVLIKGGNGDQPAPENVAAVQTEPGRITVTGKVTVDPSYQGTYQLQVFLTSSNEVDAKEAQGRRLIATESGLPAGDFSLSVVSGSRSLIGDFITVTATPSTPPLNTSAFSKVAVIGA